MNKSLSHFSVGFLFLGAIATGSVLADTLVATDSSWKVTAAAPAAVDWNSNTGFDDSGWQSATELYAVGPIFPAFSPAQGIWSSGGQFSTIETQVWVRRVFNLASLPSSALLNNGFDDDGDLYINGTKVVDDHNGFANNSFADITSYLVAGDNLIAFTVTDNYPVWGYNHSAWVHVEAVTAPIPEPEIYAMMGMGLGLLGWVGRRRKLQAA